MADTYTLISSVTVGAGGASSIDFTSIPATYTDLCLKMSVRNVNDTLDFYIQFNGSTSNLSDRWLYGNGSAANSTSDATLIDVLTVRSSYTASTFGNAEIYIPNYAGSNNKSLSADSVTENNATASYTQLNAGLWSNTAAITSIKLLASTGNIAQYSTAYLYGIKNS